RVPLRADAVRSAAHRASHKGAWTVTTDEIMSRMDEWVKSRGNGMWVPPEAPPGYTTPIQQVKAEVAELVEALLALSPRAKCLEIGLGEYGGTHVLWRHLFDEVHCVEINPLFVSSFVLREGKLGSKFFVDDSLSERAL